MSAESADLNLQELVAGLDSTEDLICQALEMTTAADLERQALNERSRSPFQNLR